MTTKQTDRPTDSLGEYFEQAHFLRRPTDDLGQYNEQTCFLAWSPQCGAADRAYLLAQVDLVGQDGFDVVVEPDASGKLWAVNING
jgi:hypothetical protein